jgi:hypothetical protein
MHVNLGAAYKIDEAQAAKILPVGLRVGCMVGALGEAVGLMVGDEGRRVGAIVGCQTHTLISAL